MGLYFGFSLHFPLLVHLTGALFNGSSAYFSIFIVILGLAGIAVVLLKAAWGILKKARFKILAIIPLFLGGISAFFALYILAIILREGIYSF